ncbi:probable LRR receptor-like serine/threonine-protein kinase At3g47570 [Benincasa hispida]|uniref:probable LRR receptor-like serine/threonine-protein kinase At3g47570 n=1 Tax=Benincasa hispida TaxID=102211 RepID=UPI0019006F79|nr:probable LRR receptor-like serine/threonine-protein kinase At3g47570 [Benincasa hispida]
MECGSNPHCMKCCKHGLFVMCFLLFSLPLPSAALGGNDTDRLALLSFKSEITVDPFGLFISWNESVHFCNWEGVICSQQQRVTELNLPSYQFIGKLSPSIGNLSFLTTLNLQNNSFGGEIPQEIGSLSRMQALELDNNYFVGEIPPAISNCSELQYIRLLNNNLTGMLPMELGLLTKLKVFQCSSNQLFGEIPETLGNLSSLRGFWATLNNIHGSIPSSFGQLKNLTALVIGANKLTGTIPSSIYNISSMRMLSLPVNQLEGRLPTDLGFILPNLQVLKIHTNQFSGPIPFTLSNASKLVEFMVSKNMFSGKVPSLASTRHLETFGIEGNNLGHGNVDDLNFLFSLVNCTNLSSVVISDNNFGGALPEYISNFSTKLRIMGFGRNQIHGTIPTEIGNLFQLGALGLETNQLTGSIPSSLGKLNKLYDLFLNGNKLSGEIPQSLGNLSALGRCNLRLNNLTGAIPPSLGESQNLLMLALSQNQLSGAIPKELLSISSLSIALELSENYLTGSIPLEVGKLVNLGYLHISDNLLTGVIPSTLSACTSLEALYLDGNFLEGPIPESLSSLRGIEELDLSRNNLSGKIPNYLQEFKVLNYLNLSFNNLEGEVPTQGVFKNTTAFSVLGNKQLCNGIHELNLPRCSLDNPRKQNLTTKLKVIISVAGGLVGSLLVICCLLFFWSRKKRNKSELSPSLKASYFVVSYNDLFKATNEFSPNNLIGVGGYGSVYKGILSQDGSAVAVKVFNLQHRGASKSFLAECGALKSIRHRNLVRILSACSGVDFQGNDFMALVFDFMVNGSLEKWLHPVDDLNQEGEQRYLNIMQRLDIAIDVASALDYLHNGSPMPIAHCDLKPSNVLLDANMTAHVGDFGLAKFMAGTSFQNKSTESRSIGIRGTVGYAPPEYAMGSKVSTHGDVYSYGILLLEMFTGKRPTDNMFKDGLTLNNHVLTALPERVQEIADPTMGLQELKGIGNSNGMLKNHNVLEALPGRVEQLSDPTLRLQELEGTGNKNLMFQANQSLRIKECLFCIFSIGVACSAQMPSQRMNINDVVSQLCLARENFS